MDTEFIQRNQIVERYLTGKLPPKGALDFEQFCRQHPELLEQIGLSNQVRAGLRLLESTGEKAPWEVPEKHWWEHPAMAAGLAALCVALGVTAVVLGNRMSAQGRLVTQLNDRLSNQPVDAISATRTVSVEPSRTGPMTESMLTIGGAKAQLADLKFALGWSTFNDFIVTVDRVDQGQVAILYRLERDSNGDVRIALNTSALPHGAYDFTIDGIDAHGDRTPQAWARITVAHE